MKTVYFIYKNDKINSPSLYAITDKKELKKSFMEERKKSLFIVKERELNKDEFKDIMKNNSNYLLERRGFITKPSSSNSLLEKRCEVYLTTTSYEEMDVYIKSDSVVLEIAKYTDEVSTVFNDKLTKALYKLKYFDVMSYKNSVFNVYNPYVEPLSYKDGTEIFRIDELGMFIYLYGNTMKGM